MVTVDTITDDQILVPEIAKAYTTAGRRPDRWVVERRLAELSDFIAPTVTAKAYADEIRSYRS